MSSDHGHGPSTFLTRYVFSTDHKVIGIQFTFLSLFFVIIAGALALGVRYQLAWPQQDVPFKALLPGNMTNEAPEANVGHWNVGGEVELLADIEAGNTTLPAGARARIEGFPGGLAVTLPAETIIELGGSDHTLAEPRAALVDAAEVMGSYQYKTREVLAVPGTSVTLIGEDGTPGRRAELIGRRQWLPNPTGAPIAQPVTENLALPVHRERTEVTLTLTGAGEDVDEAQAAAISKQMGTTATVPAAGLAYTKDALTTNAYLQLFTMHATLMVFFVLMPMLLGGFGNFLIPLMIGARDMAFPKLNMLSYWIAAPSAILILLSFWTAGGASEGGWTMYPTLTRAEFSSNLGATLWLAAIALVGFSTIVGTINYITTILNMRAPGMGLFRMPLTIWTLLVTAVLALLATPVLTAAGIMLLLDRTLGTMFFDPSQGGQPLLWQHLFWFFGHPEVYILILPAMGIASDVLSTFSRKPIFGYKPMVYATMAIAGLGFVVWGHHMFQSGMNPTLGTAFMAATIMIALPSAIKTFNWLGTLWGGDIRFTPPMLFAIGFVSMFVIGGLSGIFMAAAPVDIPLHDTYFIVAHIHYVFFGGTLMGVFTGIYYWYPKMFGRQMDPRWGVIHFILTMIAINGTFFLMHVLGIGGHPRRYASIMEYPTLEHLQPMNVVMTIFSLMLGVAQFPFLYNFFVSLPRRLSRATFAAGLIFLGLPFCIGLLYWEVAATDAGYSTLQVGAGYLLYAALLLFLFVVMLRQLPVGGKIGAACVLVPLALGSLILMGAGSERRAAWGDAESAWLQWLPPLHATLVAIGLSVLFIAAVLALCWGLWWIAGKMPLVRVAADKAMWVFMLPAFLSPLILKQDFWLWLGTPAVHQHAWTILGLFVLPGLGWVLLVRPRDAYGAIAPRNPWEANTLEWCADSPPIHLNFETIPTVYRGPYEYSSPACDADYLPQEQPLAPGAVEPAPH